MKGAALTDWTERNELAAYERPRLRLVTSEWITQDGRPQLLLRDHLRLTEQAMLVPRQVAILLSLFDGVRDRAAIRAAYTVQTGLPLRPTDLGRLIEQLDETLLLDGPRAAAAYRAALTAYRSASARPPALAGRVYPVDPQALTDRLDAWLAEARQRRGSPSPLGDDDICAVVCPHIDYGRGADVYADVWLRAADAVREADVIVIFGTDHHGRVGSVTPTRQRYATPLGVLPNDEAVIHALVTALGEDEAFAQELNHRDEHSIELAAVWIQHLLAGRSTPIVPILTGSFHSFIHGADDAAGFAPFARAIAALRAATQDRRVLTVAAADLAHVGPAFGDPVGLDAADKRRLAGDDAALLTALATGRPETFLQPLIEAADAHRICGLPPVYLTLRYLDGAAGEITGYKQCPADAAFGSLVSIGGVLLRKAG